MIVVVNTGRSFKGAGLYYLHDKRLPGEQERLTKERVPWTHALNTMESDPAQVLAEMRQTAFDQPMLKQLSGNRVDGRPTDKTVMTVALAWHVEQEMTREQMIEAAESYLRQMGWAEHQVLMMPHTDAAHDHLHLIVNRVHPVTGLTLDASWVKKRTQEWARAYEREQGKIYCENRERRAQGLPYTNTHMAREEWEAWKKTELSRDAYLENLKSNDTKEWDSLRATQRSEREAFWVATKRGQKELRAEVVQAVKEEFAPKWQAYAAERAKADEARAIYERNHENAVQQRAKLGGREKLDEARDAFLAAQKAELKAMRDELHKEQRARTEELAKAVSARFEQERAAAYERVKAEHRDEKTLLRVAQAQGTARPDITFAAHQQEQAKQAKADQFARDNPTLVRDPDNPLYESQKLARQKAEDRAAPLTTNLEQREKLIEQGKDEVRVGRAKAAFQAAAQVAHNLFARFKSGTPQEAEKPAPFDAKASADRYRVQSPYDDRPKPEPQQRPVQWHGAPVREPVPDKPAMVQGYAGATPREVVPDRPAAVKGWAGAYPRQEPPTRQDAPRAKAGQWFGATPRDQAQRSTEPPKSAAPQPPREQVAPRREPEPIAQPMKSHTEAMREVRAAEAAQKQQAFRRAAVPLPERPQPTRAEVPREAVNRLHAASQARAAEPAQLRPEQARRFDAPRTLSDRWPERGRDTPQRSERPTNARGETTDRRAEQSERSREQNDAKRARTDAAAFREAVDAHARSRAENRGRDRDGGRDRDR